MAFYGSLGNSSYDFTGKTLTLPSGTYKLVGTKRIYAAGAMSTTNTTTGASTNLDTYTPVSSSGIIVFTAGHRTYYTTNRGSNYHHYNFTKFTQNGSVIHSQGSTPYQGGQISYNNYAGFSPQAGTFSFSSNATITVSFNIISDSGPELAWDMSLVFISEYSV